MEESLIEPPMLTTNRTILCPFAEQDLSDLYEYCSQDEVGESAGWARHTSMEMSRQALRDFIRNKNQFAVVYRENNKVIGHICIHDDSENNRSDTKELGYALNRNYWNRGIMTEVLYPVLDMLFKTGIENVYAAAFKAAPPPSTLLKSAGLPLNRRAHILQSR